VTDHEVPSDQHWVIEIRPVYKIYLDFPILCSHANPKHDDHPFFRLPVLPFDPRFTNDFPFNRGLYILTVLNGKSDPSLPVLLELRDPGCVQGGGFCPCVELGT
jgi:hypothetical protein